MGGIKDLDDGRGECAKILLTWAYKIWLVQGEPLYAGVIWERSITPSKLEMVIVFTLRVFETYFLAIRKLTYLTFNHLLNRQYRGW